MSAMQPSNLTVDKIRNMLKEEKRFDGRGLLDHREIEIDYDVSNKAEGAARVRIGKTEVLAGVKLALAEPYPDSPDKGNLIVSGDLLPLASPRFEMGPPRFPAIELPRVVDRGIRESGMIEFEKLVVTPGEKVWTVFIDLYPINDDGNLMDAATIATIAALKKTVFPEVDKDGNVDYTKRTSKGLPLSKETAPIGITFYKFGESLVLDPTREEEEASDVRITFGVSKWNKQVMINSSQKSRGDIPFTQEEIEKMMEILPKKFEELDKKLKKAF